MKRGVITNNGQGIHISGGEVWMTSWEIADLFNTTAAYIQAAIKRILKTNVLKEYEVCKYIKLENGNNADVYHLDIVIALSHQINTGHSIRFRKWIANKIQSLQKNKAPLFISLDRGMYFC